jgi:hypothetical protein
MNVYLFIYPFIFTRGEFNYPFPTYHLPIYSGRHPSTRGEFCLPTSHLITYPLHLTKIPLLIKSLRICRCSDLHTFNFCSNIYAVEEI